MAFEGHRSFGHFVAFASREDVSERGFAGAVRAHQRMHLTGLHFERESLENVAARDADVEIVDFQHHCSFSLTIRHAPSPVLRKPSLPAVTGSSSSQATSTDLDCRTSARFCQPMCCVPAN